MSVETRRSRPKPFADPWDGTGTPRPPATVANPLGAAGRVEPPSLAQREVGERYRRLTRDELTAVPRVDRVGGVDLSPDGTEVVFAWDRSGAVEIYSAPIVGDRIIQLTGAGATSTVPRWSPDGHWVAFMRRADGSSSLHRVDRDGEHERRIAAVGGNDLAWSPDGTRIAFGDGRSIGIVEVSTGSVATLGEGARARWSPDGSAVLFSRAGDLVLAPAGGGAPRPIVTRDAAGGDCSDGVWSPDGSTIAFTVRAGGRGRVAFANVRDGAVGRIEHLGATPFDDGDAAWRPDGRGVVYLRREKGNVAARRAFTVSHADDAVLDLPGSFGPARVGRDSETVVAPYAAATGGVDVVVRPKGAVEIARITRSLPPEIDAAILVEPAYVVAEGAPALVYVPHAEAGLVAVALVRAAPERDWDPAAQLLAGRGHVVVVTAADGDAAVRQARAIVEGAGLATPGGVVEAVEALAGIEGV